MSFEDIVCTKKDGAAHIVINRPQLHNAFRTKTIEELKAAFDEAERDGGVGVVVLSGAGGNAFCAGGDVQEMASFSQPAARAFIKKFLSLILAMRGLPVPIIAAVDGYCLGGGNELNLACDLTIATEKSQFGQVGPTVGSSPVMGGTQYLPRLVGEKRAREIVYLCRRYSAREAERMGWINKTVEDGEALEKEVGSWCRRILEMSPQAIRVAKASINFESDLLYPSFIHALEIISAVYGTEELHEGMSAFLEKRKPLFDKFRRGKA